MNDAGLSARQDRALRSVLGMRARVWCSRCAEEWPPERGADGKYPSCCRDRIEGDMEWIKSSASNPSGNCVELAKRDGWIFVRDSKDPAGPMLRFSWAEIDALFEGAALGDFDHLEDVQ